MKFDWVYMFGNSATCGTDYNINTSGCNGSDAVELQEVAYFYTTLYFPPPPPSICLIIISDFFGSISTLSGSMRIWVKINVFVFIHAKQLQWTSYKLKHFNKEELKAMIDFSKLCFMPIKDKIWEL